MGNPCQGVLLYEKNPDVAGLGRVEVQRGDNVLQQAFKSLTLLPAKNNKKIYINAKKVGTSP
jgi:hypothetical protein